MTVITGNEEAETAPRRAARRGVTLDAAREWLAGSARIEDIECIIPDQAGRRARQADAGRRSSSAAPTMTLPASIFTQTITGEYPEEEEAFIEGLDRFRPRSSGRISRRSPSCPGRATRPRRSSTTPSTRTGAPFEIAPRNVLKRVVELYADARLEAGRGAGDGVLPRQAEHRSGLSAGAAGRPLGPAGARRASPIRSPRSTSSTSCSTTSTTSPRRRASRSTR